MLKKILLSVMIFGMVFATFSTAAAKDIYAFSENGIDYYVTHVNSTDFGATPGGFPSSIRPVRMSVDVVGVKNNSNVDSMMYDFMSDGSGAIMYRLIKNGKVLENTGISRSPRAQKVYRAAQNY